MPRVRALQARGLHPREHKKNAARTCELQQVTNVLSIDPACIHGELAARAQLEGFSPLQLEATCVVASPSAWPRAACSVRVRGSVDATVSAHAVLHVRMFVATRRRNVLKGARRRGHGDEAAPTGMATRPLAAGAGRCGAAAKGLSRFSLAFLPANDVGHDVRQKSKSGRTGHAPHGTLAHRVTTRAHTQAVVDGALVGNGASGLNCDMVIFTASTK